MKLIMFLGEVKLSYTKKNYFISMQTFQLAILVLFEKANDLTSREIQEATQLSDDPCERHIQSLLDCKLLECADKV